MKRRDFGLLASTSLAATIGLRPRRALAAQDQTLLTTTLTPLGGERAGNADGSIPAWTGGLVSPPLPADQSVKVQLFTDEAPLFQVNASNMDQYANLLTAGTKVQIQKYGMVLNVYPTHRTAAAPQYVYDNTLKNVTRAVLDPRGGRFGFTGAVCGPPFPIIDTSDPLVAGAQLIWNHLTSWTGFNAITTFNPGVVTISGRLILVSGTYSYEYYPYYAPDVTPENYDGYYNKAHFKYVAPASVVGQEQLVWHTTNVNVQPDIVWELLNGQGRVRKAPDEQYDSPNPLANGISVLDESSCFYGNPSQYNWNLVEKREMLVPYNCNKLSAPTTRLEDASGPHFFKPEYVRWEKHRVWIVEATLAPGEHNVNMKRRLYIDEDTWLSLLGEGYDGGGNLWKAYCNYNICTPSLPGTTASGTSVFQLMTGDWTYDGNTNYGQYVCNEYYTSFSPSELEPQEMAANASF